MSHAYEVSQERLDELVRRSGQGLDTPDAWDILTATRELVETLHEEVEALSLRVARQSSTIAELYLRLGVDYPEEDE